MSSELRNKIARDIWTFAVENHMWLSISHIPGVDNIDADLASCELNPRTEWSLPQDIFDLACHKLNFYPVLDLFASRLNNKTSRYMSYCPDPFCEAVDTFTVPWNSDRLYLFLLSVSWASAFENSIKMEAGHWWYSLSGPLNGGGLL